MSKFIKIGQDYYNTAHIIWVETCGQSGDRWYRAYFTGGTTRDIDEAGRLRILGAVKANSKPRRAQASPETLNIDRSK